MILELDFSGFGLRLSGEDSLLAELDELWRPFKGTAAAPVLEVAVERVEGELAPARRLEPGLEETPVDGRRRLARVEGSIDLGPGGEAVLRLPGGDPARRLWGGINLLIPALGGALPAHGGLLLHGAAALLDGRVFLLTGESGSGKTTWATACAAAGLPVLSDDQVLLDAAADPPRALGSPLRARDFPAPGRGRWPLAAVLLPRHGAPALRPVSALRAHAVLQANALYSSPHDRRATELLARLATVVPVRELTFAPDPSFVPLLRDFAP
ncbi:MAG TPA: hypothetical protein VFV75_21090 [Candidatus Polarisedimenticolaceae bacterium]|nr:hypothetical protein [Candidatus Polarisedimenticolaceae bacterium]